MNDVQILYRTIKQWLLHYRHPSLERILKRIEKGRMGPDQAKRWLKRIRPWVKQQEIRFNPFGPAPQTQEELGDIDIEIGCLLEKPDVRIGFNLLDRPRHTLITGETGYGKSNLIRRIIYEIDALNRAYEHAHHDPAAGL
jgi:hypothetical protein